MLALPPCPHLPPVHSRAHIPLGFVSSSMELHAGHEGRTASGDWEYP